MDISIVVGLLSIVGALASSGYEFFISRRKNKSVTLEQRITTLTEALQESSQLVAEVESEIQTRKDLVVELKKDAEKYQQLITLNQEQVDAVAQVLQGELRREGGKSFWKGVAVNFIFFVFGAAISYYLAVGI